MRPDELYLVLPAAMLKTERATVASYHELKARYKTLLKDKHVSDHDVDSRVTSDTWRAVHDVRTESVGVQYDSHGQVVIDKVAAERIIRYRLSREPLGFGAALVRVWTGVGVPLRTHRRDQRRRPPPVHVGPRPAADRVACLEWHADNTIVGQSTSTTTRRSARSSRRTCRSTTTSATPRSSCTPSRPRSPRWAMSGGMVDSTLMADSNRVSGALRAGHRHASLTGAGGMQLNLPIGGLGAASADAPRPSARGGGLTARDRAHRQGGRRASPPPRCVARQAVLLTTEGDGGALALSREHVNKVRAAAAASRRTQCGGPQGAS